MPSDQCDRSRTCTLSLTRHAPAAFTVAPDFFTRLPTLLAGIPTGEPWHAVRFDTWGALS